MFSWYFVSLKSYLYYFYQAYFGGEARCDAEAGQGDDYDPSELICGACSDVSRAQVADLLPKNPAIVWLSISIVIKMCFCGLSRCALNMAQISLNINVGTAALWQFSSALAPHTSAMPVMMTSRG